RMSVPDPKRTLRGEPTGSEVRQNCNQISFDKATVLNSEYGITLHNKRFHRASTIAALINPANANAQIDQAQLEKAAGDLDLQLRIVNASNEAEIGEAFSVLAQTIFNADLYRWTKIGPWRE